MTNSGLKHIFAPAVDAHLSEEDAADLATYRALFVLGIALDFLFWLIYRSAVPSAVDPLWGRALFALLPGSLLVASYYSASVRRQFSHLWRFTLYVFVGWSVLLSALNGMTPPFSIGCVFSIGGAYFVFSVGLDRFAPLLPFSIWCLLLPALGAYARPMPESERTLLLASLVGLVLIAGLVIGRNINIKRSLRREKNRFETLYESLPTPVAQISWAHGDPRVVSANEAFEAVFGEEDDSLSRALNESIPEDELQRPVGGNGRRQRPQTRYKTEVERATCRGTRTFQLNVAGRVRNGETREIYVIYTDITDQKERERRLEEAKEEAEKASRLKSTMLANMSHEVRTPLTSIIGFSEMLTERLEGELRSFATSVHDGAHRLMDTLNSMLRLSNLEAEEMSLEAPPVNLRRVAEETVGLMEPKAKEKTIQLTIESEGPAPVPWAEDALRRVATNLLDNAVKFTPEGGEVTVRVRTDEEFAILVVEDTGIGISDEVEADVFEAFKQESTGLSRSHEGSGLGLSITKGLVDTIGGEIEVESEKGVGTKFTVRVPRKGLD